MPKSLKNSASRRRFIQGGALAGAAGLLSVKQSSAFASSSVTKQSGTAKNVIFLVADGLSHGTLGLAHHWSLRHRGECLNWIKMLDHAGLHHAQQDTASASSPVTDSAAAASAWGSGVRVNNGSINYSKADRPLKPLMAYAKERGKATGLVSTCRITHATPAGFAANVRKRDEEEVIARQYLDRGIDLILGGGLNRFKTDDQNLIPDFRAAGYSICEDRKSLQKVSNASQILGLFSESHLPYALDRKNDPNLSDIPGLLELFQAGLQALKKAPEGFLLQVESGRIDHAGHANDPAAILHEYLEFDRCIEFALEYAKKDRDTLVIVTTDHGTGGCQLDGLGKRYGDSGPALERINRIRNSFEWMTNKFEAAGQFDAALFEEATGIKASTLQIEAMNGEINNPTTSYLTSTMGAIFSREFTEISSTGWSSNNHTAEVVDFFALGPGSEPVEGFMQNTEAFYLVKQALGLGQGAG